MPLSSFEVAMQTMASVVSYYLEEEKGVPLIPKDGLNQLVKEQFPHCEKKEICPGVYKIRIPLVQLGKMSPSSPTEDLASVTSGDELISTDVTAMLTIEVLEGWRDRILNAIHLSYEITEEDDY